MSKHKRGYEGKDKFHKGRMPAPSEAKLGTRVHASRRQEDEEDIPEVDKCPDCGGFTEVEELDSYEGVCYRCSQIAPYDPEFDID